MLGWLKSDIFAKFMGGFALGIVGVVTFHFVDGESAPVASAATEQSGAVL